ncbi:hypothetical protein Tco_0517529 [Tanacetum coccineum]
MSETPMHNQDMVLEAFDKRQNRFLEDAPSISRKSRVYKDYSPRDPRLQSVCLEQPGVQIPVDTIAGSSDLHSLRERRWNHWENYGSPGLYGFRM